MVAICLSLSVVASPAAAAERLRVLTLDGRTLAFSVDVVETPEAQARGLMFVKKLPPRHGMLFPNDPPRRVSFWMRNTLIPLDLIFIAPGGMITQIVTRTDTQSDARTNSLAKVSAVLELNAGTAAKNGFGIGDSVAMTGRRF